MEEYMFEDALTGRTDRLSPLPPVQIQNVKEISEWTPLHIACLKGDVNFAKKYLLKHSQFLEVVNPDGCSALHLAASCGRLDIVELLLEKADSRLRRLCMKKDEDGRTPLHHAVINFKDGVEIVQQLLQACPESSLQVTHQKQTVFHLLLKNKAQVSGGLIKLFSELLKELPHAYAQFLLNLADKEGNTVLHLATVRKQIKIIQLLMTGQQNLEVNAVNSSGSTALDLLGIDPNNETDIMIEKIFLSAGGIRLNESHEHREHMKGLTTGLLMMASLTAATSCQVALNQQWVSWIDPFLLNDNVHSVSRKRNNAAFDNKFRDYELFVLLDSLAFLFSVCLIVALLYPTPAKHNLNKWFAIRILAYLTVGMLIAVFLRLVFSRTDELFYSYVLWSIMPVLFIIGTLCLMPIYSSMSTFHARYYPFQRR